MCVCVCVSECVPFDCDQVQHKHLRREVGIRKIERKRY